MKSKLLLGLFLCTIALTLFAENDQNAILKIEGNLISAHKKLITDTFLYLNTFWADKGKSL